MINDEDFSQHELLDVAMGRRSTKAVADVLSRAQDADSVENVKDEAMTLYWRRKLFGPEVVPDGYIAELLNLPRMSSARRLIGDAARLDILSSSQVENLQKQLAPEEWPHKQVQCRALLTFLSNCGPADTLAIRNQWIEKLVSLSVGWAVRECVDTLYPYELAEFERMLKCSSLSKRDKHEIVSAVHSQRKENLRSDS